MQNTLTVSRPANRNDLWTPWGPQAAAPHDRKFAKLRGSLKQMRKPTKHTTSKTLDNALLAPAELS